MSPLRRALPLLCVLASACSSADGANGEELGTGDEAGDDAGLEPLCAQIGDRVLAELPVPSQLDCEGEDWSVEVERLEDELSIELGRTDTVGEIPVIRARTDGYVVHAGNQLLGLGEDGAVEWEAETGPLFNLLSSHFRVSQSSGRVYLSERFSNSDARIVIYDSATGQRLDQHIFTDIVPVYIEVDERVWLSYFAPDDQGDYQLWLDSYDFELDTELSHTQLAFLDYMNDITPMGGGLLGVAGHRYIGCIDTQTGLVRWQFEDLPKSTDYPIDRAIVGTDTGLVVASAHYPGSGERIWNVSSYAAEDRSLLWSTDFGLSISPSYPALVDLGEGRVALVGSERYAFSDGGTQPMVVIFEADGSMSKGERLAISGHASGAVLSPAGDLLVTGLGNIVPPDPNNPSYEGIFWLRRYAAAGL